VRPSERSVAKHRNRPAGGALLRTVARPLDEVTRVPGAPDSPGAAVGPADLVTGPRAIIDLHCHTNASFDSLASPASVVRAAAARGLTHLAITDHDRIDGALRARDAAPAGLAVIVGEEVRTLEGDLICVFLERPIPSGTPVLDAIAAARDRPTPAFHGSTIFQVSTISEVEARPRVPMPAGRPLAEDYDAGHGRWIFTRARWGWGGHPRPGSGSPHCD